ncbi:MAG: LTA synthase family protein [Myxococcota bacterium]
MALPRLTRYKPVVIFSLVYLAVCFGLRLVLWWRFGTSADVPAAALPGIIAAGVVNDAVELLYLMLPVSLVLLLFPERWFRTRVLRVSLFTAGFFWLFGMFYLAVVEYYFFDEFDARLNLVAVDYLVYPHEVLINIWESYPVATALGITFIASALVFALLRPALRRALAAETGLRSRAAVFGAHAALLAVAIAWYPTDALSHSQNRVGNQIAENGVSSFFRALRTSELDYDAHYRTGDPERLFSLLTRELGKGGGTFVDLEDHLLDRRFPADPNGLGKLNVVVLLEESFGAAYIGAYDGRHGLSPAFDALAKQGVLFKNAYATGTRTVRGIEAIATSFPPIPSESIVKRPGCEHIANWGEVMRAYGYHTSFLYGGFGAFDNMNHFFRSNGFAVSDRADIEDPKFANIWGVSDEDLFRHAVGYFDRLHEKGKPFFSIVLSTSNHKPFTFPEGIDGVPPEGGGRSAGIRYADYAIGEFFRQARTRPWYGNTLFVVVADHGARVYGRDLIPLFSYEIPLLVLAPGHLAPRVVNTLTSQMDIAPTILGMLGLGYEAPFFGQNVLGEKAKAHPLLFNHNHDVALYRNWDLLVLGLQKKVSEFRYDRKHHRLTPEEPERPFADLTTAYYQTAFELFEAHKYD